MKVTWLGQAGLLFESGKLKIMVDPYLSDSVGKRSPEKSRRQPIDESIFDIRPDVLIFTHNHLDHYDPETVSVFFERYDGMLVLAPFSVFDAARKFGGTNNYVVFNRGTSWTEKDIRFTATRAEHSDPFAIGVIIEDGERKYYVTGDTLYNEDIFGDLPEDIFAMFLPVNGVGNNMNMEDGVRFCERVKPEIAVPFHCGIFDSIDLNEFPLENKVIPKIYREIELR